jgi:trimethylamine--corrinoid protein Co-methyltransferase
MYLMKLRLDVLDKHENLRIHEISIESLEKIGLRVHLKKGLELLKIAGAKINRKSHIVYLPAGLVNKALQLCSPVFTLYGRDGASLLRIGGNRLTWGACAYPSVVLDWKTGEYKYALLKGLEELSMLTDQLDNRCFLQPSCCSPDVFPEKKPTGTSGKKARGFRTSGIARRN